MGYYVKIVNSTVIIPAVHLDRVFNIFQFINRPEFNELKSGGSWADGRKNKHWYSWMNDMDSCKNTREIIEMLGFTIEETDAGIHLIEYDSKTGQEDLFIGVIGHLITGNIQWVGEDGYRWEDHYPSYNNVHHQQIIAIMTQHDMIEDDFFKLTQEEKNVLGMK